MAKNIQVNNVILQYTFLEVVNPVSHKFSFNCLIPQDHPQVAEVMAACAGEWAVSGQGAPETAAQSMGYNWVMPNDAAKIHPNVLPMLDPTKQYLMWKGVQEGNTDTPTVIYDSLSNVITNRRIIGEGTIANVSVSAFGYQSSGQKGVKLYGQWIQIVSLVENPYANISHTPAPMEAGGFVADAAMTAQVAAPVAQDPAQAGFGAPAGAPVAPVYAAPAAPVAAPVYAAPAAPVAAPVYAAPVAPVAPVAAPVYAAPVPPVMPAQ